MDIFSRNKKKKLLEEIYNSNKSTFLAVYGRWRIGKTYLVTNFFNEKGLFFHITGTPFESTKQQLWNFSRVYSDTFNSNEQAITDRITHKLNFQPFNLLEKILYQ